MSEKFEEKTLDAYWYGANDFTESGVIMVTITLAEYRQLVACKAKAEQRTADEESWQLRQEVERLKQQIVSLTVGSLTVEGDAE